MHPASWWWTPATPSRRSRPPSPRRWRGDHATFTLTDTRGRRVIVPAHGIAYLEIGTGTTGTVGFRG